MEILFFRVGMGIVAWRHQVKDDERQVPRLATKEEVLVEMFKQ
jgi:hypothetical protein